MTMKRGEQSKGKEPWMKKKFTVINEKLIHESVAKIKQSKEEMDEKKHQSKHIDHVKIDYQSIKKLVFSFRNLYKISNLEGFNNLKILLLDNNNIQTISNVNHLTQLSRLDLSFNKIAEIPAGCFKGLENLENLSLFANDIEELKNLDDLRNLKCLNVGRNGIKASNVKYLRRFKKLRSLVLCNNPIFQDRNYKNIVLEFLSRLTFLDHRLVLKKDIEEARGRSSNIHSLEAEEERERKRMTDAEEIEKSKLELRKANIEGLYDLYDEIFQNCPVELRGFEFFTNKIQEEHYKRPFNEAVRQFKDQMFSKLDLKLKENEELDTVLKEEKEISVGTSRRKIKEFEKKKKKVFNTLSTNVFLSKNEGLKMLKELEKTAKILGDELIEIEVNQSEAFNEIIAEFVENYRQLNSSEVIETYFEIFRDIDNKFSAHYDKKIIGLAKERDEIERNKKEMPLEQLEQLEKVKIILDDMETLKNLLEGSKKERTKVLAKQEDFYINIEKSRNDKLISQVQMKEHERNRMRIFEIWSYLNRITGGGSGGQNTNMPSEITMMKENFLMSKKELD